ncbi:MAG TPA: DUF3575 domain-containing protein [Bacteroidia bacterium]
MKKILHIIFLLLSIAAFGQKTDSTKKGIGLVLKTDVLMPTFNGIQNLTGGTSIDNLEADVNNAFSFSVEKLLGKRHSIQITFIEKWSSVSNTIYNDTAFLSPTSYYAIPKLTIVNKANELIIIPEYKYFVSKKKAHTGYYIGAYAFYYSQNFNRMFSDASQYIIKTGNIGAGFSNGVQFYLFKRITVDALLQLGIIMTHSIYEKEIVINPPPYPTYRDMCGCLLGPFVHFYPRLAINIGYKF